MAGCCKCPKVGRERWEGKSGGGVVTVGAGCIVNVCGIVVGVVGERCGSSGVHCVLSVDGRGIVGGGGGRVGGKLSSGGGCGRTWVGGWGDEGGGQIGELLHGEGWGPLGSRIGGCHGQTCCW